MHKDDIPKGLEEVTPDSCQIGKWLLECSVLSHFLLSFALISLLQFSTSRDLMLFYFPPLCPVLTAYLMIFAENLSILIEKELLIIHS